MRAKIGNGRILDEFVEALKSIHKDQLVSVILYGSRASGDHIEGVSDCNLLVVLQTISPDDLRASQPAIKSWTKAGNPMPVYFTEEEISDAADVFPIEFREMSEVRRVLWGSDTLEGLVISDENLRHQLEYELRGKLIRLRSLYVPNFHSGVRLTALMTESLSTFALYFRHVLRLLGQSPPAGKRAVVAQLARQLGLNTEPFERIFDAREKTQTISQSEAERIFAAYLMEIQKIIEVVDSLTAGR